MYRKCRNISYLGSIYLLTMGVDWFTIHKAVNIN